jgi:hypothetical protein
MHGIQHWVDSSPAQFSDCEVSPPCPLLWRDNPVAALLMVQIARTFPSVFGYGTALAVTLAAFEYTGGTLWGKKDKDQNLDKYEQLEKIRKNYRTPAEETIAQLGEGRGMCRYLFAETRYAIVLPEF